MAPKTVKKATAKPMAKKAPVKKTAAKSAPMEMKNMNCACGAGCKCCGGKKIIKKIIIFLVIFALGFCAGKMCVCKHAKKKPMPQPVYVNGCLDAASIKCPKMQEVLPIMDLNQDGCIVKDEYNAVKQEMRRVQAAQRNAERPNAERPNAPRPQNMQR